MRSRVIFVVSYGIDPDEVMQEETSVVNFLIQTFPQHIFLYRGSFVLIELNHARSPREWGDYYVNLVPRCDALYCHAGDRRHPLADLASDLSMPILDDPMDVELYLETTDS